MKQTQQAKHLLNELEQTLIEADLWSSHTPSTEQLNSVQPFAIDTLSFEQWLQFIFIPKMHTLIENNIPLPQTMNISPMAQECLSMNDVRHLNVITVLTKIDHAFS